MIGGLRRTFEVVVVEGYVLRAVQFWFDWPVYALKRIWNFLPGHTAIDNEDGMDRVQLERSVAYGGNYAKEKMHILTPEGTAATPTRAAAVLAAVKGKREGKKQITTTTATRTTRAIVYCHGGGFVATCREMYYNSLAYLVRAGGFHIAVLDYPMAPQARHPVPLLSVMRALDYLHQVRRGHASDVQFDDVHLFGDSAGSNLILHAAALIRMPALWERLKKQVKANSALSGHYRDIDAWRFPRVTSCISIYGMLSRRSAENASFPVGVGLRFLWRCVTNGMNAEQERASKLYPAAFDDLLGELMTAEKHTGFSMPPTFFAVGDIDPLVGSSLVTHERMSSLMAGDGNRKPLLRVFPSGFHGFFGVPPEWQLGLWRKAARPAAEDVFSFLERFELVSDGLGVAQDGGGRGGGGAAWSGVPKGRARIGSDFYGVVVISSIAIFMPLFIAGAPFVVWTTFNLIWREIWREI